MPIKKFLFQYTLSINYLIKQKGKNVLQAIKLILITNDLMVIHWLVILKTKKKLFAILDNVKWLKFDYVVNGQPEG